MKPCLPALIIWCFTISGCTKYYIPVQSPEPTIESIKKSIEEERYFILRGNSYSYAMNNVRLTETGQQVSCELSVLPKEHTSYIHARKKKHYYFNKSKPDSIVLNETHLYAPHFPDTTTGMSISIPIASITGIEKIEFDKKRTHNHNVKTAIGITVMTAATVAITISLAEFLTAPISLY